jgi:hypothetical protein
MRTRRAVNYPWLKTGRPDRITKTEEARRRFADLSGIRRRKEDDFARVTHNAPVGGLHTAGLAASKWRLTTQPNYSRISKESRVVTLVTQSDTSRY